MDMPPTVHLVDHIPQFPIIDDVATDDDDDDYESHNVNYQPISAFDDGSDSDDLGRRTNDAASPIPSNGVGVSLFHFQNPNPRFFILDVDSALTAMDLNGIGGSRGGYVGGAEEDPESEEAEEEERMRQLEASISRAFSEDEKRRSAPLTPENAAMILDAMRGVIFQGMAPDWAVQVPEDQWVDRLRRLER